MDPQEDEETEMPEEDAVLAEDAVAGGLHSLHSRGGSLDWCRYVDRPYRLSSN